MPNDELACATRAQTYAADRDASSGKVLAAADVLRDHGPYAFFCHCKKASNQSLQTAALEALNSRGFHLDTNKVVLDEIRDKVAGSLERTFTAHRLLTTFLDYAYLYTRAGEKEKEEQGSLKQAPPPEATSA